MASRTDREWHGLSHISSSRHAEVLHTELWFPMEAHSPRTFKSGTASVSVPRAAVEPRHTPLYPVTLQGDRDTEPLPLSSCSVLNPVLSAACLPGTAWTACAPAARAHGRLRSCRVERVEPGAGIRGQTSSRGSNRLARAYLQ